MRYLSIRNLQAQWRHSKSSNFNANVYGYIDSTDQFYIDEKLTFSRRSWTSASVRPSGECLDQIEATDSSRRIRSLTYSSILQTSSIPQLDKSHWPLSRRTARSMLLQFPAGRADLETSTFVWPFSSEWLVCISIRVTAIQTVVSYIKLNLQSNVLLFDQILILYRDVFGFNAAFYQGKLCYWRWIE